MLKQNGEIEPLNDENIVLKTPDHVSLELRVPQGLRTDNPDFSIKCDDGVAYITNKRLVSSYLFGRYPDFFQIIYLAARPTATFHSFSAFILDTYDPQPRGGGWLGFGAWRWKAEAKPRPGGGIPGGIPRIELTLIFNHGGIDAYHSKYSLMYERLNHARDVGRETGARITVHDDDLPPYTPAGAGAAPAQSPSEPPSTEAPAQAQRQQSQPTPAEPPPGYDEAQAQAVEQQFDERDRQDAERAQ
ncbi:hypothetical protein M406DRAFT_347784 [Cryphonectria parasitica EP155]|uniref:Uncharacterized protein n=1 Tax=Cryphonectria parasitica (strain ATCC 38755 / EP155) TaxID=660469 RepID=A0A9P4XUS2_CRYP1|nr:uncharacterized protein M406DRAFT_347784 [Cryphonectria parasitica EP155]KAF3761311.1 hypothetical protein M406DRAFT_347784 [Cryphonectria parasitica EP155]